MMWLGIDDHSKLIYEGGNRDGACAVWPSPVVTPASFCLSAKQGVTPLKLDVGGAEKFLFREDAFDPVTRIRRGRFYAEHGGQPNAHDWRIVIAPPVRAYPNEVDSNTSSLARKTVHNFQSYSTSMALKKAEGKQLLVVLGAEQATTLWTIVNRETSYPGEELVTLKARQSMGVLPEVNWTKVPLKGRKKVREEFERLENEFRHAGPESVVDRSREAATAVLSAWHQTNGEPDAKGKDLAKQISIWEKHHGINQGRGVACAAASVAYAAEIPQRFHSRVKHAEKERLNLRPLREQDAEFAVQCVGIMLCDLGWAEWF